MIVGPAGIPVPAGDRELPFNAARTTIIPAMNFKEKKVLITGGSRGIGEATARALAQAGAAVAISYRTHEQKTQDVISSLPGKGHRMIQADVSIPDDCRRLVEETVAGFGRLDVLVNNAGVYFEHPIDQIGFEDWQAAWRRILAVNLIGAANLCYHAAQHMIRQRAGRIINVSSRGAFRGEPSSMAYGASKAGLNSLSQSLARALAPYNVFVGVVAPGFVETDMTKEMLKGAAGEAIKQQSPLGRVAKPEEVAYAIMMFAAEGAEFMTGGIIDVNGASYLRS